MELPKLSIEEVRMVVEIEKQMGAGTQAYVVCENGRWAFPAEIIEAVGLKSGDVVTRAICYQLQLLNLQYLKEQIVAERDFRP